MPVELKNLKCVKQTVDFPQRPLAELELLDHIHGCVILQPENGTPFHNFGYWDRKIMKKNKIIAIIHLSSLISPLIIPLFIFNFSLLSSVL